MGSGRKINNTSEIFAKMRYPQNYARCAYFASCEKITA